MILSSGEFHTENESKIDEINIEIEIGVENQKIEIRPSVSIESEQKHCLAISYNWINSALKFYCKDKITLG